MSEPRAQQSAGSENWSLSIGELKKQVEEHYKPWEPGKERWFRCQRSMDDGTVCGRKVFFPHGVVAHENHHSITSGNGPLISQNQSDSLVSEESEVTDHDTSETEDEIYDSISSEFDDLV